LHSAITKIRDKAIVNRDEALTHASVLNELFDLELHAMVDAERELAEGVVE
jgi:hypothetical protein